MSSPRAIRNSAGLLLSAITSLVLVSVASGCGGGGAYTPPPPPPPTITSVTVSCSPSIIQVNQTSQCMATVAGTGSFDSSVTWSVDNGTVDASGNYTAPAAPATATVKATSKQDSTKSGTATITVQAAPTITSVTVSCNPTTLLVGQTSQCSATLQGTGNFNSSVTWSVNTGSISSSGVFTAPNTAGTATVKATSKQDSTKSGMATITVNPPPVAPTITQQPASQTVVAGQTATFSVVASGTTPLNYQWQKNGTVIVGATSSSYTTPATTTADSGSQFSVVVSNVAGSITSALAMLTVNPPPVAPTITQQPTNQTVIAGQTATFSVVASGTQPLGYQWQKNGTPISGATAAGYTTPATTTADSGSQFNVVVTNVAGSITSASATLTVNPPPVAVSVSPASATVIVGATQQFTATVTGTANTAVTWSVNGIVGGNVTVGSVSVSGLYTAPNQVPNPQTLAIKAVSQQDQTKAGTSSVTIWRTPPTGSWQRTGPNGGTITVLAEDVSSPGTIFAGASHNNIGGLWKSTDAGGTWTRLITNSNLDSERVADIAVVNGGQTIYAPVSNVPVFSKSTDGGATWTEIQIPAAGTSGGGMAVDPQNSSTIYLSHSNVGVLKSQDAGATWALLSSSPVTNEVLHNAIQVDPRQTNTIYYGTDHGLYISRDGGTTWSLITNGFASSDADVRDVAVDPADQSKILVLAGPGGGNSTTNLYQSIDAGNSWVELSCCLDGERVVPDPLIASTIYLSGLVNHAVYKSIDGGRTFAISDNGMPLKPTFGQGVIVLFSPTGTMLPLTSSPGTYLATVGGAGVFRSQDAAQSWTFSSSGISGFYGLDIAVDPGSPATVYLAACEGIFKSKDSGLTWAKLTAVPTCLPGIAVDPFDSSHVLAHAGPGAVAESHDGGSTWQDITSRFPPPPSTGGVVYAISFHPTQQGTIYISVIGGGVGVMRSTDGGITWTITNSGLMTDRVRSSVTVNPQDPNMLFLGTDVGLFKSIDGGNSWVLKTSQATSGDSLSIDSKVTPVAMYAAGSDLYKSVDLGETWSLIRSGIGAVAVDPSSPNSIFTIGPEWSPDGGLTWMPLTNGLGVTLIGSYNRMAIAQGKPQMLFVPSFTDSILRFIIGP